MGILDQLLEKKDLTAFIEFRIQELEIQRKKTILKVKEKKRGIIHERFMGRIAELEYLRKQICRGTLKQAAKKMYRRAHDNPDFVCDEE
jgi:hypothetical protein